MSKESRTTSRQLADERHSPPGPLESVRSFRRGSTRTVRPARAAKGSMLCRARRYTLAYRSVDSPARQEIGEGFGLAEAGLRQWIVGARAG